MSAHSIVTIQCDAPNCALWEDAGVSDRASWARRQLAGSGWRLNVPDPDGGGRRLDYCPRHADNPDEPTPLGFPSPTS